MKIDELLEKTPQLPEWHELPDIELYMDQVINLGNRYLEAIMPSPLTASMVNSYVKKGLMPKPNKKKYSQEHLTSLILITTMKQVYSLDDIHAWIITNLQGNYQKVYNKFCHVFNQAFRHLDLDNFDLNLHFNGSSRFDVTLNLIVQTIISKIISEHLINEK